MKRLTVIAAAIMVVGLCISSAFAASTSTSLNAGTIGFNVGFGNSVFGDSGVVTINGKYFVMDDLAIVAGIGTRVSSGDRDADYYSLSGGARKYLKTTELAPFIEARFTFAREKDNTSGPMVDQTAFDVGVIFGGEYFLHKQLSLEGGVGLGFGKVDIENTAPAADEDYTYFGTRTVGLSANFYF